MNTQKIWGNVSSFSKLNKVSVFCRLLAIAALCGVVISFLRTGITSAIFYSFCIVIYSALLGYAIKELDALQKKYRQHGSLFFFHHPILTALAMSIVVGILLEFLTLAGAPASSPLALSDWGKKRLIIYIALCFLGSLSILRRFAPHYMSSSQAKATKLLVSKQTLNAPFLTCGILFIALIAALVCGVTNWQTNAVLARAAFLCICTIIGVLSFILLRKRMHGHPEYAFLIISLLATSFLSFSLPPVTGTSWDAQIHFDRSLGLSYLGSSQYGEAEAMLVSMPAEQFSDPDAAARDLTETHKNEVAISTRSGFFSPVAGESLLNISTIGYIPSAVGLWLGRVFDLSIIGIIILGRLSNAICYCLIMGLAIRIIPFKKYLLFTIGLLPTPLFLASNYSYDPWVVAFLSLGIATILRERSVKQDTAISASRVLTIVLVLFLGLCPKAIYFPVIALMYLIPSSRFRDKKTYHQYCAAVLIFGCLMFASFMLPMLFSSSAQAGDARGGSDVNALGQIVFILTHPMDYILIASKFIGSYIFTNSAGYSFSYAYMGSIVNYCSSLMNLPLLWLVGVSLFDSAPSPSYSNIQRVLLCVLFLFTVFLVASSLYVSFTPVGLETVNGCQPRYLLPIIFIPLSAINLPQRKQNGTHSLIAISTCSTVAIIACNLLVVFGVAWVR